MSKFYKLIHINGHINYDEYEIIDEDTSKNLDGIYYKIYGSVKYTKCGGSVGLLASDIHEGYCQLYYTTRNINDIGNVTIEFVPAYTKDGQKIYIKTNTECPFCMITTTTKLQENGNITEYSLLTFNKYWH